MIDPKELRTVAEAAKAEKRRAQEEVDAQISAEKKREHADAMAKVPEAIARIESDLQYIAQTGSTYYSSHWQTIKYFDRKSPAKYRCILDSAQAVVDHFVQAGFKACVKEDHTTEYYPDGASPGLTHISIEIDWSENEESE